MENTTKFAKTDYFNEQRIIRFGQIQRLPAAEVGAQYADSKGMTNRLTFVTPEGEEKTLSSTSFGFYKAFKDSGLTPGDRAFVQVVRFQEPGTDKTYNCWAVQKIWGDSAPATIQAGEGQAASAPAAGDDPSLTAPIEW